jgi:TonB family protein
MKTKLAVRLGWLAVVLSAGAGAQTPVAADATAASAPLVKSWVPPKHPSDLEASGVKGKVVVHFVVDEYGKATRHRVVKSSDPRFDQAALESVTQWVLEPAMESGKPVPMGVGVTLYFTLPRPHMASIPPEASNPVPLPKTGAIALKDPDPDYPADMLDSLRSGEATVDLVVEPDGRATGMRVIETNDPAFVRPALAAVKKLTFTPAMQGDLPVRAKMRSPMRFSPILQEEGDPVLAALTKHGFSLRVAEGQSAVSLCESLPQIWSLPEPVFPRAAALAGQAGEAVVNFEINELGFARAIELVSCSAPEFGERLLDTLSAAVFKAAMKGGRTVAVPMQWKHVFALPAAEPAENETSEARLIRLLQKGEAIASAKGLDAPLTPLWRVAPEMPPGLEAGAASADVEVIIDREGRVRLPVVVKTASETFGRAALVAASRWVFEPPMRGGQPVDVRVRLPFR